MGQSNITTAQEFIATAMRENTDMFTNTSKLDIVNEIDQEVATRHSEETRQHWIDTIQGKKAQAARNRGVSLLEIQSETHPVLEPIEAVPSNTKNSNTGDASQSLIASMTSALDSLAEEQRASEESLKAIFATRLNAGEERRVSLLTEQQELNATKASEEDKVR